MTAGAREPARRRAPDARRTRRAPAAGDGGEAIDGLDREIIEVLQENGRASFRKIAAQLGVSEATVRNRYARLSEENVLQVVGVTDPLRLGFDSMAMLGVKTTSAPEPVADEIASWNEAGYVVITAGQFDLLVELVCVDRRHLLDVINRVRSLEGVASTESFVYLELAKEVYNWGARPGGAALERRRASDGNTRSRRSR